MSSITSIAAPEQSRLSKLSRTAYEQSLQVIFSVGREPALPRWVVLVFIHIEFLQLLRFLFPDDLNRFPWDPNHTTNLRLVMRLVDGSLMHRALGGGAPFVLLFIFVGVLAMGHWFCRVNSVQDAMTPSMLLSSLRISVAIVSGPLFTPAMDIIFLLLLHPSTILEALLGFILAPLLVWIGFVGACSLYQLDPSKQHCTGAPNARSGLSIFASKIVFPFFSALSDTRLFLSLCTLLCSLVISCFHVWFVPLFDRVVLSARTSTLCMLLWASICTEIAELLNDRQTAGPVFMFIGGCPLVVLATSVIIYARLDFLHKAHVYNLSSPFEFEAKVRLVLQHLQADIYALRLKASGDSESTSTLLEELAALRSEALQKCLEILDVGTRVCSASSYVRIQRAQLYFFYLRQDYLGYAELAEAARRPHAFDISILIHCVEEHAKLNILQASENHDVLVFNEYEHQRRLALLADFKALSYLLNFWNEMSSQSPRSDILHVLSDSISAYTTSAAKSYSHMLRLHTTSFRSWSAFEGFVRVLLHDESRADSIRQRCRSLQDAAATEKTRTVMAREAASSPNAASAEGDGGDSTEEFKTTLFADETAIVVISGVDWNFGEILHCNSRFCELLGAPADAVIGNDVSLMIPSPIAEIHNELAKSNLIKGSSNVLRQRRRLVMLTSTGHVVDIMIYVKVFVQDVKTLAYMGVIDVIKKNDNVVIIVVNHHQIVTAVSESASKLLNIDDDRIQLDSLKVQELFADYDEVRESCRHNTNEGEDYSVQHSYVDPVSGETHLLETTIEFFELPQFGVSADVIRTSIKEPTNTQGERHKYLKKVVKSMTLMRHMQTPNQYRVAGEDDASTEPGGNLVEDEAGNTFAKTTKAVATDLTRTMSLSSSSSLDSIEIAARNEESFREEQRRLLVLLQRWAGAIGALAFALLLVGFVYGHSLSSQHNELVLSMSESTNRAYDLVSIALYGRELDLIRRKRPPHLLDEPELRRRIRDHAALSRDRNAVSNAAWSAPVQAALAAPTEIVMRNVAGQRELERVPLRQALAMVPVQAQQLHEAPLALISEYDNHLYFVLENFGSSLPDALIELAFLMRQDIDELVHRIAIVHWIPPVASAVLIVVFALFVLLPSVYIVLEAKTNVFVQFVLLRQREIDEIQAPFKSRWNMFMAERNSTFYVGADNEQAEAELALLEDEPPPDAVQKGSYASIRSSLGDDDGEDDSDYESSIDAGERQLDDHDDDDMSDSEESEPKLYRRRRPRSSADEHKLVGATAITIDVDNDDDDHERRRVRDDTSSVADKKHRKKADKKRFDESSQHSSTRSRGLWFIARIALIVVSFVSIFVASVLLTSTADAGLGGHAIDAVLTSEQKYLGRKALFEFRELAIRTALNRSEPSRLPPLRAFSAEQVADSVAALEKVANGLLFGSSETPAHEVVSGRASRPMPASSSSTSFLLRQSSMVDVREHKSVSSAVFELQFANLCTLDAIKAPDCATFDEGVNENGLHALLEHYSSKLLSALDGFATSANALSANDAFGAEALLNRTLSSAKMLALQRIDMEFLSGSTDKLLALKRKELEDAGDETTTQSTITVVMFVVVVCLIFVSIGRPMLKRLSHLFEQSQALFQLIPFETRIVLMQRQANHDMKTPTPSAPTSSKRVRTNPNAPSSAHSPIAILAHHSLICAVVVGVTSAVVLTAFISVIFPQLNSSLDLVSPTRFAVGFVASLFACGTSIGAAPAIHLMLPLLAGHERAFASLETADTEATLFNLDIVALCMNITVTAAATIFIVLSRRVYHHSALLVALPLIVFGSFIGTATVVGSSWPHSMFVAMVSSSLFGFGVSLAIAGINAATDTQKRTTALESATDSHLSRSLQLDIGCVAFAAGFVGAFINSGAAFIVFVFFHLFLQLEPSMNLSTSMILSWASSTTLLFGRISLSALPHVDVLEPYAMLFPIGAAVGPLLAALLLRLPGRGLLLLLYVCIGVEITSLVLNVLLTYSFYIVVVVISAFSSGVIGTLLHLGGSIRSPS